MGAPGQRWEDGNRISRPTLRLRARRGGKRLARRRVVGEPRLWRWFSLVAEQADPHLLVLAGLVRLVAGGARLVAHRGGLVGDLELGEDEDHVAVVGGVRGGRLAGGWRQEVRQPQRQVG